jgi:hypothetical protein
MKKKDKGKETSINELIDETVELSKHTAKIKREKAEEAIREARMAEYTHDALGYAAPLYKHLYENPDQTGASSNIAISSEYAWRQMHSRFKSFVDLKAAFSTASMASTATTLTISSDMIPYTFEKLGSSFPQRYSPPKLPSIFPKTNVGGTAMRLEKIDVDLAKTYKGVWDALTGIHSDRDRTALYQMRQTYDHFFSILAPDNEVRKSSFWTIKEGDKPMQITRRERITYAANRHVDDETIRDLLVVNADTILSVYDSLNLAHKRGKFQLIRLTRPLRKWIDLL